MRLAALLLLAGCASFDLRWSEDMPGYRMQQSAWYVLASQKHVANRCGLDKERKACTVRVREGGWCLTYSIYTIAQAKKIRAVEGGSIYEHELEHCGIRNGVNVGGGWTHPGAGND